MVNNVKYKFMLRPDTSAVQGGKYIYLYANVNGSKVFVSTGSLIPEKSWNQKEQSVKAGIANQRTINNKLAQIRIQINNLINRADSAGNTLTTSDIKNTVKDGGNADSFYQFMDKEIKQLNLTKGTLDIYKGRLNDLKKFRPELRFNEITAGLWYDYQQYLADKGNNQKTISNAFIQTSKFINKAVELELMTVNPWNKVKVKTPKSNRQFLSAEELKKVEDFYNKTKKRKYKNTLKAFLFSCYTGLRMSDVRSLTGLEISDGWINKKVGKSKNIERIPLSANAKSLMPANYGKGVIFRFANRYKIGDYLEEIMKECKINKKITFHCARHTFATISLELTGNLALVQKMLGHADIQTTQIYAKILDSAKAGLMDKWNQLNKPQDSPQQTKPKPSN